MKEKIINIFNKNIKTINSLLVIMIIRLKKRLCIESINNILIKIYINVNLLLILITRNININCYSY